MLMLEVGGANPLPETLTPDTQAVYKLCHLLSEIALYPFPDLCLATI